MLIYVIDVLARTMSLPFNNQNNILDVIKMLDGYRTSEFDG